MAENENPATPIAENTPTQTLFRFVSLRSPQLSDEKDQDKRFVLMPDEVKTDSHFYLSVKNGSGKKRDLLLAQASTFEASSISKDNSSNTLDQFKYEYKILYNFATWLAKNKSTCKYAEFVDQTNILSTQFYPVPDITTLWDNFIYQVVTQKEFYIKEVMMQMILALHTLQMGTNEEETMVLLAARIVLPKEMMVDDTSNIINTFRIASNEVKETFPTEEMKQQQEISSAKIKLSRIESLKKNLSVVEKKYNKEYQAEYKVQNEAYQRIIAPIMDEYNAAVAAAKEEYCGIRPPGTEYNPEDPCQQPKEVPYPKLPNFEFNFRDEVTAESFAELLKEENLDTLLDVLGYKLEPQQEINSRSAEDIINDLELLLDGKDRFAEITSIINENIEGLNNIIIENTQGNEETFTSIGGIIIPVSKTSTVPFTYQLCPRFLQKSVVFDLALNVPDSSWDISYAAYILTPNSGGSSVTSSYYNKSRTGNTIFLSDLFQNGIDTNLANDATLEFKATCTNGKTINFFVHGVNLRSCVSSSFEVEIEDSEPPVIIEDEDNFIPSGFGFKRLGVADYLKVEQSTHAYVEGEVANIENVMAREYREKSTRKLRRSENTTTSSSDLEREQLTDTTTANRYEMQNEISRMMQEATDIGASANAHMSFLGGDYTLDLGANYANHRSKEESTRQAVTQSQDITARAMDRIVTKVHEERIEKIIDEFEENNSHGFDNRKGDKHVVGVYRWVDKLMKNQIYNYGKRMMFEFMIPEPAKLHTLGMMTDKSASQTSLIKPEDPRAIGNMQIANYGDLADDTKLKYWSSKYNFEIDQKPDSSITLGKGLSFSGADPKALFFSDKDNLTIPDGYAAKKAKAWLSGMENLNNGRGLTASAGDVIFVSFAGLQNGGRYEAQGYTSFTQEFRKSIPIAAYSSSYYTSYINISIYCELTQEAKIAWQQKTFKAIIDAYKEALVDYNNKLAEEKSKAVEIKDSNPNFYRQIENTVLRKNCISYMSNRAFGSTHGYGLVGLTQGSTFTDYETTLSVNLDKYTAFVKFMEQAFEWDNLSYYLYPYYWGNKQNWVELYQSENTDPLFRNFLQSGMARVIVTVRPGFEDVVQFYLATGKIWNGGEVPVIGDELYLSIVDEMKEPKGNKEGKAWLTRLPTTLNILQAESIGLKVAHALPFTTENPNDFEVPSEVITEDKFNFEKNENLLGLQPEEEEEIISGDWE